VRSPYQAKLSASAAARQRRLASVGSHLTLMLGRCIALPIPGYCATNSSNLSEPDLIRRNPPAPGFPLN